MVPKPEASSRAVDKGSQLTTRTNVRIAIIPMTALNLSVACAERLLANPALSSQFLALLVTKTALHMIIDQARTLHKRITNSGSYKLKTLFFQSTV